MCIGLKIINFYMNKLYIIMLLCFWTVSLQAQDPTPINEVQEYAAENPSEDDPDVNNLVIWNTDFTVEGLVLNGDELGAIRYVQDNTGAIGVYDGSTLSDVDRGDVIRARGALVAFAGLLEISGIDEDDLTIVSTGNELPTPLSVDAAGFNTTNESRLVTMENVTFEEGGTFQSSSSNYNVTFPSGETVQIRVNASTNIAGTTIPSEQVSITGIMSRFNSTFQLLPRDLNDFEFEGNPPVISSAVTQSNLSKTGFTVNWETISEGTTTLTYGLTEDLELGQVTVDGSNTSHSVDLEGLEPGSIYYVQVESVGSTGDPSASAIQVMGTVSESSGDIEVYFNSPVATSYATFEEPNVYDDDMADKLIEYIESAEETIDIAIYNIDDANDLIFALNAANAQGVDVRLITDGDAINNNNWEVIQVPKVKSPTGFGYGLMHNKFIIIDAEADDPNQPMLLTGSMNMTNAQVTTDDNNIMSIQDQTLARAYQLEFNEMWSGNFGPDKKVNTPREFLIGDRPVELYFSPTDGCNTAITRTIGGANVEILWALFVWTREEYAYAIENAIANGVFAAGVVDAVDVNGQDIVDILGDDLGDNFAIDEGGDIMHHKYLLVDPRAENSGPTVATGSFNYSNNALFSSDENLIVIEDANIANQFFQDWAQRFENAGGDLNGLGSAIQSLDDQTNIAVYPNPVTDYIDFFLDNKEVLDIQIDIFDLQGKNWMTRNFKSLSNTGSYRVDVSDLPAGTYVFRANNASQTIIIQH